MTIEEILEKISYKDSFAERHYIGENYSAQDLVNDLREYLRRKNDVKQS